MQPSFYTKPKFKWLMSNIDATWRNRHITISLYCFVLVQKWYLTWFESHISVHICQTWVHVLLSDAVIPVHAGWVWHVQMLLELNEPYSDTYDKRLAQNVNFCQKSPCLKPKTSKNIMQEPLACWSQRRPVLHLQIWQCPAYCSQDLQAGPSCWPVLNWPAYSLDTLSIGHLWGCCR